MSIVLVSDVFGITPALLKLKDELTASVIIDPYQGNIMDFKDESEAYAYFVEHIGLDHYGSILMNALEKLDPNITLIGFSVGASAIWQLSSRSTDFITQAICFYGSQIRNATHIEPSFKIDLFLPKSESHFNVDTLINKLTTKPNTNVTQVDYLHGFMNYHSVNFNQAGYDKYVRVLNDLAN